MVFRWQKRGYFLPEKFKKDRLEFILLGTLSSCRSNNLSNTVSLGCFALGLPRFVVGIFAL